MSDEIEDLDVFLNIGNAEDTEKKNTETTNEEAQKLIQSSIEKATLLPVGGQSGDFYLRIILMIQSCRRLGRRPIHLL